MGSVFLTVLLALGLGDSLWREHSAFNHDLSLSEADAIGNPGWRLPFALGAQGEEEPGLAWCHPLLSGQVLHASNDERVDRPVIAVIDQLGLLARGGSVRFVDSKGYGSRPRLWPREDNTSSFVVMETVNCVRELELLHVGRDPVAGMEIDFGMDVDGESRGLADVLYDKPDSEFASSGLVKLKVAMQLRRYLEPSSFATVRRILENAIGVGGGPGGVTGIDGSSNRCNQGKKKQPRLSMSERDLVLRERYEFLRSHSHPCLLYQVLLGVAGILVLGIGTIASAVECASAKDWRPRVAFFGCSALCFVGGLTVMGWTTTGQFWGFWLDLKYAWLF